MRLRTEIEFVSAIADEIVTTDHGTSLLCAIVDVSVFVVRNDCAEACTAADEHEPELGNVIGIADFGIID